MRRKRSMRLMAGLLSASVVLSMASTTAYAQTLSEAGKEEVTTVMTDNGRGYGGYGNQDKSRTENSITVKVSIGASDEESFDSVSLSEYVLNKYGEEMRDYPVTFGDKDGDGDIDTTDLMKELENLKVGSTPLNYTSSDMGDFYSDFFGVQADGWSIYTLNNIFCNWGTPDLYDEDVIKFQLFKDSMEGAYFSVDEMPEGFPITRESGGVEEPEEGEESIENVSERSVYLDKLAGSLSALTVDKALSDGSCYWQELRILRFAKGADRSVYDEKLPYFIRNYVSAKDCQYDEGKLTAVNAMRVASITGDTKYLDVLAHGYNGTDAATYDKKAGSFSVDYILMCLDLNNYATSEAMADNLADYASSESVRDDLISYIVNTAGCWGGSWWSYDTGAQNAQALVPYANKYPEVKEKLDTYLAQGYQYFMDESNTGSKFDASAAGEYIRFAAMYGETDKANDVYNKIESMGIENTKFKGNGMDVTRMAIAEWGLNGSVTDIDVDVPAYTSMFTVTIDPVVSDSLEQARTEAHIRANKTITTKLFESEIIIPEGITVKGVSSEVTDNVEYAVNGNTLRVTVGSVDGSDLVIDTGKDLIDLDIEAEESGVYEINVKTIIIRNSSEEFIEDVEAEGKYEFEVLEPMKISVTTLYEGNEKSEFLPSNMKAVKIVMGSALEDGVVVLTVNGTDYICYESTDFTSNDTKVYVALVDKSLTKEQLENAKNYSLVKTDAQKLMFGDANDDSEITSADALEVVRLWVGKSDKDITSKLVLSYNVTGDNTINNADTLAIVEKITDNKDWAVIK